MSNIQIFSNPDYGDVRTVLIEGEPWFVSVDISKSLGYAKTDSMTRLVDEDDKKNISSSDLGEQVYKQNYTIGVINESGLYAAIFGSKQENAKKFKKWVTSEVLPSIRKTGSYGVPQTIPEQIQLLAQGNVEVNKRIDELDNKLEKAISDLPILGIEENKISNAVRRKGVECLGGKESSAYKNRSLRQSLYSDLHKQLRREFGVTTYRAIRRNQTDTAVGIIKNYKPPLFLADQIEQENAQMHMNDIR